LRTQAHSSKSPSFDSLVVQQIGVASYGAVGHVPLDFQLFDSSGHFRAAQTLDIRLRVIAISSKTV